MRISTTQIYLQGIEAFGKQQVKLSDLQQQISTGVKLSKPSDDPAASTRVLELQEQVSLQTQYQENIESADTRLKLQETTLTALENISHRLRELSIQGNSGVLDITASQALGVEVNEILEEMVSLANVRDANGDFLFAGFQNQVAPFTMTSTGSVQHVVYNGDEGQRLLQVSESRQIAVDNPGSEIFLQLASPTALNEQASPGNGGTGVMAPANVFEATVYVPGNYEIIFTGPASYDVFDVDNGVNIVTGATYADSTDITFQGIRTSITGAPVAGDVFSVSQGQYKNIFESVQGLADMFNRGASSVERNANTSEFLTDLDTFFNRALELHTSVGGRLNNLENQKESNEAFILSTKTTISSLRDTDLADAVSRLTLEQTTLDAAQAVFARISSSSLFKYLR
ncbi:MAG: flagellar hook-associated protein FlgL [Gammaproteobacteria bacterium]|nr:flagellar hook-associated protein FlgL [Gammaproteobacteria bacterium]